MTNDPRVHAATGPMHRTSDAAAAGVPTTANLGTDILGTGTLVSDGLSALELAAPAGSARLVVQTTSAGPRGVFSVRRIPAGRLVESCPVLVVPVLAATAPEPVRDLLVEWFGQRALVLGYGALYRHAEDPNAFVVADRDGVARLFACREILPGHEITIDRTSGFR